MQKIVLVLIVALLSANAMSLMEKYPINFSNKRSIMTLLTQVEAQLKAKGPLDAITTLLDNFLTTITEEQVNHDALWAEQQAECASETEFRNQEISNAVAALQEASETLSGCQSQQQRAEADFELTKKQLVENRNFLAQVEDTRRRQAFVFEDYTASYALASTAVDDALVLLEEIFAGESSFVQLSRHVNGLLKHAIKVKKAHLMTGVMAALVQLANTEIEADSELLNQVKKLLVNFGQQLDAGLQETAAAEDEAIQAYEEEQLRLSSTIDSLNAQHDGLEAELNDLDKCIIVQSSIVSAATTKRDRNQALLTDADNLCASVENEYTVATESRKEELELLAAIKERVELRFSQLSTGVQERGREDTFSYDAQNNYETSSFSPSL